jgi:hypothetical protein
MSRDLLRKIYSAACTTSYSLPTHLLIEIEAELSKPETTNEPVCYILKSDLELLERGCETYVDAWSVNVGSHTEKAIPLYKLPV